MNRRGGRREFSSRVVHAALLPSGHRDGARKEEARSDDDSGAGLERTKKPPVFTQWDLNYVRGAAARTLQGLRLAASWGRQLSGAEVQLFVACSAVCEIITGQLGQEVEDGVVEPVGDLRLRQVPGLPVCHQPKLEGNGQ